MKKISHQVHLPIFSSQSCWNRRAKQGRGGVTKLPALTSPSLLKWRWVDASDSPALLLLPDGADIYLQRETSRSRFLIGTSGVIVPFMHIGTLTHEILITITYRALPDQLNKQVQEKQTTTPFSPKPDFLHISELEKITFIINLLSPFPKWNLMLLSPE